MRRRVLYLLGSALLVMSLLALAIAAAARIVICDYPGGGDGRTATVLEFSAAGVIFLGLSVYALARAARTSPTR